MFQLQTRSIPVLLLIGCLQLSLAGCSGGNSGPQRHDAQGRATYAGKPIPKGMLRFTPDSSKGNQGPGAIANIDNGSYETKSGRGVVSGPHIVVITGFDGIEDPNAALPDGAPLFKPYTTQWDFEENNTLNADFDVPSQK